MDRTQGKALIVRTAWVYAAVGHNFVKTMIRLFKEREEVRVVGDQIGTPTEARGLAQGILKFAAHPSATGVFHWTDAGVTSWYDFAVAIADLCAVGGLELRLRSVVPITTRDYPTPAKRPSFGVLDKTSTWMTVGVAPHWQRALRRSFRECAGLGSA